jgi:hypothetical protein
MTKMTAYYASARTIYKFWRANGFSSAQACGLLAQADAESSLEVKAVGDRVNDKPRAFGLDQWHGARANAILKGCGVDLAELPPLADQLKGALWELEHPEGHALVQIKSTKTAYDAGYAACRYWERPGSTLQYSERGAMAEAWAVYFQKNPD